MMKVLPRWQYFKQALRLQKWPVLTPDELKEKEQKERIRTLFGA